VGIGPVPKQQDPPSFVLGKFSKYEQEDLDETIQRAADAAESWVTIGIEASMNRYN
jgi:PTH1 family peptidyl-tRNA hydrolase